MLTWTDVIATKSYLAFKPIRRASLSPNNIFWIYFGASGNKLFNEVLAKNLELSFKKWRLFKFIISFFTLNFLIINLEISFPISKLIKFTVSLLKGLFNTFCKKRSIISCLSFISFIYL